MDMCQYGTQNSKLKYLKPKVATLKVYIFTLHNMYYEFEIC